MQSVKSFKKIVKTPKLEECTCDIQSSENYSPTVLRTPVYKPLSGSMSPNKNKLKKIKTNVVKKVADGL